MEGQKPTPLVRTTAPAPAEHKDGP
jgi:hypothetical protein